MSRPAKETITCPKCGHNEEVIIWQSLNNMLSPDKANELLYGNLFGYTCPKCGDTTELCYSCLYHDMENHAMMQYVPDESQAEATATYLDDILDGCLPQKDMDDCECRYRIVFSHNSLREKARIFHDRLDDRAIEILKLMIDAMASESADEMGSFPIYYERVAGDDDLEFVILADEILTTIIPRATYDELRSEPRGGQDREYFVDRDWAIENYSSVVGAGS